MLGDILRPEVGMARDVLALLKFARTHGFLKDALYGLASTALSDYRQLRTRVGLQRYGENEMIEKLAAGRLLRRARAAEHRPQSLADDLRGAPRPTSAVEAPARAEIVNPKAR